MAHRRQRCRCRPADRRPAESRREGRRRSCPCPCPGAGDGGPHEEAGDGGVEPEVVGRRDDREQRHDRVQPDPSGSTTGGHRREPDGDDHRPPEVERRHRRELVGGGVGDVVAVDARPEDAQRILSELETLRLTEYVDAYYMAMLRDALGQRLEAFDELERACRENSAPLYAIEVDPKMNQLRADARFARIRRRNESSAHTREI